MKVDVNFSECFGYENVKEIKSLDDITLHYFPDCMENDYEYYMKILRKVDKRFILNRKYMKDFIYSILERYVINLLKDILWENYKTYIGDLSEQEMEGPIMDIRTIEEPFSLFKYKDYYVNFWTGHIYEYKNDKLILTNKIKFHEIDEDEINTIGIFYSMKQYRSDLKYEIKNKKLKNKYSYFKKSFDKNILNQIVDFDEANEFVFESAFVEQEELDYYLKEHITFDDYLKFLEKRKNEPIS